MKPFFTHDAGQAIEIIRENEGPKAKKPWAAPYVILGEINEAEHIFGATSDGGGGGLSAHS